MNLALLQPAGLLALAALVVPLVLHLARRSEHRSIDFAALRWISARARPRSRVRIVERSLLLLRVLLIGALALLLAEPLLVTDEAQRPWSVVAPGVDRSALPEDASADGHETTWRWLAPGFPPLHQSVTQVDAPVASLLRELDARLPTSTVLTVWVPAEMSGLDGASLVLRRSVNWRVVPGRAPLATRALNVPRPFAVRYGADRRDALTYLQAAWTSWSLEDTQTTIAPPDVAKLSRERSLPDVAQSSAIPRGGDGAMIWLRDGALPASVRKWVEAGGTIVVEPRTLSSLLPDTTAVVWRDERGAPVARASRLGQGRVVRLEFPLTADRYAQLGRKDFPRALRDVLYPPVALPQRSPARVVVAATRRMQPERSQAAAIEGRALTPWIALLVAILFAIERFFATSAHRWRST